MKHKTTRDHYEKWEQFAKDRHIAITNLSLFGLAGKEDLLERYKKDPNLNNIPLSIFDNLWITYRCFCRPKTWALYEGACVYKHLLKYQVLNLEPSFLEE